MKARTRTGVFFLSLCFLRNVGMGSDELYGVGAASYQRKTYPKLLFLIIIIIIIIPCSGVKICCL